MFVNCFLLYVAVVLAIGVSTNIEGFAKSVFNQESLNLFNKLNTAWLVVYFFVLQYLQASLQGVFTGFLLFYCMRGIIAAVLASRQCSPTFAWYEILSPLLPSVLESAGFIGGYFVSKLIMQRFAHKELLGFAICCVVGVTHVGAFVWFRRKDLKKFKQTVRD